MKKSKKKVSKKKVSKKKASKKRKKKAKKKQTPKFTSWYIHALWHEISREDYNGVPEGTRKNRNVKRFVPTRPMTLQTVKNKIWPRIKEYEQSVFDDIMLNTNGAIEFKFVKLVKIEPYDLKAEEDDNT